MKGSACAADTGPTSAANTNQQAIISEQDAALQKALKLIDDFDALVKDYDQLIGEVFNSECSRQLVPQDPQPK